MLLMTLVFTVLMAVSDAESETPVEMGINPNELSNLAEEKGLSGRIVFTGSMYGNNDIFLLNLDTGLTYRLTFDEASDHRPALSYDGSMVIFVSERDGQPDVYRMILEPEGSAGSIERLTWNTDEEFDLGWSITGYNYRFSSCGTSDMDRIGFFLDPEETAVDVIWSIFSYNPYMNSIDRMSLEPGDYRYPCQTPLKGTVYARRSWGEYDDSWNILGYFHGALASWSFEFPYEEITGPIRNRPDSTILIPCWNDGEAFYAVYDISTPIGCVVDSIPAPDFFIENVSPDPENADSDWYIAQTGQEGEAGSEIVLVHGLGMESPEVFHITSNNSYDGEPDWQLYFQVSSDSI